MVAQNWRDPFTDLVHLPGDDDGVWCMPNYGFIARWARTTADPTCAFCRWHFDDPSVTLADIQNSGVV